MERPDCHSDIETKTVSLAPVGRPHGSVKRAGAVRELVLVEKKLSWCSLGVRDLSTLKDRCNSFCFLLLKWNALETETWIWPLFKEMTMENSCKTGSPELWLTATLGPGPCDPTMCLIKVNRPSLNFQDQVAVTHCTDQKLISCHEKFWTKQQTQTLLIDSSEAQEAAKFGK